MGRVLLRPISTGAIVFFCLGQRLHTNTAYVRLSGFNGPSCGASPAEDGALPGSPNCKMVTAVVDPHSAQVQKVHSMANLEDCQRDGWVIRGVDVD